MVTDVKDPGKVVTDAPTSETFYKDVVQAVLLFRSESWVMINIWLP